MREAEPFYLDVSYRGGRNYVHSTSIANALATRFPDATSFELLLRKLMTHRLEFQPASDTKATAGGGHAFIVTPERNLRFEITEDHSVPVHGRDRYDEDAVPLRFDSTQRRVDVGPVRDFTFFDRLVAANKTLINRALDPGVKLLAVKLATPGFPADDAEFAVEIDSHVGKRIFKSTIWLDGEKNGEVVFYGQ